MTHPQPPKKIIQLLSLLYAILTPLQSIAVLVFLTWLNAAIQTRTLEIVLNAQGAIALSLALFFTLTKWLMLETLIELYYPAILTPNKMVYLTKFIILVMHTFYVAAFLTYAVITTPTIATICFIILSLIYFPFVQTIFYTMINQAQITYNYKTALKLAWKDEPTKRKMTKMIYRYLLWDLVTIITLGLASFYTLPRKLQAYKLERSDLLGN